MTRQEALARLGRMVASTSEPVLDSTALADLLLQAELADDDGNLPDSYNTWSASTSYAAGSIVVPTTRNGSYYTAAVGISGSAEPTWPTTGTVTDNTVVWTWTGSVLWTPRYDLNRAAAEGWRQKAAMLAGRFNFSADGASYDVSQAYDNCLKQVAQYQRRIVGSAGVRTPSAVLYPSSSDTELDTAGGYPWTL